MRDETRTRHTLSDAWESTIKKDLFDSPCHCRWHAAIAETKLTQKFTIDEEGTDLLVSRMLISKLLLVERGRFYGLFADIEAPRHIESGLGCTLLTSNGEEKNERGDEFRERVGTTNEKTLMGEARIDT